MEKNFFKHIVFLVICIGIVLCGSITCYATISTSGNRETVHNFLKSELGFNEAAACGAMANIQEESNFNPTCLNTQDTGGTQSYGICQWNNGASAGDRYSKLITWCNNNGYSYSSFGYKTSKKFD